MALTHTLADWRIKLLAAKAIYTATRPQPLSRLTLRTFLLEPQRYEALTADLLTLPVPTTIVVAGKVLPVPQTAEEVGDNITYGQRLYFEQQEQLDLGVILRYIAGYYYPLAAGRPWDETEALAFGRKVLSSLVIDLYPVAKHLTTLMATLVENERKLLYREPTKQERAAGIDKLAKFAPLTNLMFLASAFGCTQAQVPAQPYKDCLVRFMLAKEQAAFNERLAEIHRKETAPKQTRK
jgi:hypothetical protein